MSRHALLRASSDKGGLGALAKAHRLRIATVDVEKPDEIAALSAGQSDVLDLLLVNAGVGGEIWNTPALEDIIVANAVGPIRVLDALIGQVAHGGVAAVMTSALGSVGGNERGGLDGYRASKAALNSLTRSFAARHPPQDYTLLSLHPGWVRTDMGGPDASIDVDTSVAGLVRVIAQQAGQGGHRFLNYLGQEIVW